MFEPESETAKTGRLGPVTNRPPAPWGQSMVVADDDDALEASERPSAPVGSFSSAPPPGHPGKPPPQSVVATPVALFSGAAPNMRVEPALIVTRMDGTGAQLMTSHEVVHGRPPARRRMSFGVLYGSLAALVCFATYGVVRVIRGSGTDAEPGAAVVAEESDAQRPAESGAAPPQPPSRPNEVAAAAHAPDPPASAPAPLDDEPSHRDSAPSRSRGRSRSAAGAVVASRDPRVSPVTPTPPAPSRDTGVSAEEPALARTPEPELAAPAPSAEPTAVADEPIPARQPSTRAESPPPSAAAPERRTPSPAEAAPGPLVAKAAIGAIELRGSMPNSQVRRALDRIRPQLSACYARAAQAAGKNKFGSLDVELEIDERGRARGAHARGSDLSGLNGCVAEAAGKVISEAPDTGTVRASFKVLFSP
jgi:hypothetical protein